MEENFNETTNEMIVPKRPTLLTVLCVLTFISSGLAILSSLLMPIFADSLVDYFKNLPSYDEDKMAILIKTLSAGWGYYICIAIIASGSCAGAVMMWKLKKMGFHIYALSNLMGLFLPTFFLGITPSVGGIITSSGFIVLYAINLKHLK